MDFTLFVHREQVPALTWLGQHDWLSFGQSDFEQRRVWTRPKQLNISPEDRSSETWTQIGKIIDIASKDVVGSFLLLALSKSIAGGPKVFQPTVEDCEALENTACTMAFEDYKQPYPVVIIEFPVEYRRHMAKISNSANSPSHVIVHHDSQYGFITVSAFFDRNNVLTQIIPARPEYKTIEDAIVRNKDHRPEEKDFEIAELAQRLAVNFCMVMVLLGVRQVGALDPEHYNKARKMANSKNQRKANLGKKLVGSTMFKIAFIQQKIKLYEEEFIQPRQPILSGATEEYRASPKPHWRRGHYRQQPCGPKSSERKLVFIKPILVRACVFSGDFKNTEVVYTLTNKDKQ